MVSCFLLLGVLIRVSAGSGATSSATSGAKGLSTDLNCSLPPETENHDIHPYAIVKCLYDCITSIIYKF